MTFHCFLFVFQYVILELLYSTLCRDHKGLGFLAPKYHPKTRSAYSYLVRHSQAQECLQIDPKSIKLISC